MGIGAMIMGLQSLAESAHLFNDHFKLDFQGKLNELEIMYKLEWEK